MPTRRWTSTHTSSTPPSSPSVRPCPRGAILADEVGLGKTIEAGLIVAQLWAERKRRILCILPAALRKQWNRELLEKFFVESVILETSSSKQAVASGARNPFDQWGRVVLCSYQFARAKEADIRAVAWDLVVVDEAHRLRNVYRKDSKIARSIRDAIEGRAKILLTATKREARQAWDLESKVALRRQAKDLERRRNDKRRDPARAEAVRCLGRGPGARWRRLERG